MSTESMSATGSFRQVRARFGSESVVVYQAYAEAIAGPALVAQRFVPPFRTDRMTWIKPSFWWMAKRSGYATTPGQEHVLAIELTRDAFDWVLAHACLSKYQRRVHESRAAWQHELQQAPVRAQWDPEPSIGVGPDDRQAIQLGLGPNIAGRYAGDWIVSIADISELMRAIHDLVRAHRVEDAQALAPVEDVYPVPDEVAHRLGMRSTSRMPHDRPVRY